VFGRGAGVRLDASGECGPYLLLFIPDLVTPTFKTPSLFDGFLLELHIS
jgi:hypothetical protein